jgi:hypothetical protein
MTDSRDLEFLFWNSQTGQRLTRVPSDTAFTNWSCVLGWPVKAIWQPGMDGTDINAVAISGGDGNSSGGGRRLVATADDGGNVSLFRYPVLAPGAKCTQYSGHSSHVTNVRFSIDDRYLFSTGGLDLCMFQWRVQRAEDAKQAV